MADENIKMITAIYRGVGGKGVGESILEAYAKYLQAQGVLEKIILKTNGMEVIFKKDYDA